MKNKITGQNLCNLILPLPLIRYASFWSRFNVLDVLNETNNNIITVTNTNLILKCLDLLLFFMVGLAHFYSHLRIVRLSPWFKSRTHHISTSKSQTCYVEIEILLLPCSYQGFNQISWNYISFLLTYLNYVQFPFGVPNLSIFCKLKASNS